MEESGELHAHQKHQRECSPQQGRIRRAPAITAKSAKRVHGRSKQVPTSSRAAEAAKKEFPTGKIADRLHAQESQQREIMEESNALHAQQSQQRRFSSRKGRIRRAARTADEDAERSSQQGKANTGKSTKRDHGGIKRALHAQHSQQRRRAPPGREQSDELHVQQKEYTKRDLPGDREESDGLHAQQKQREGLVN